MKAVCLIILILLYLGTAESEQAFKYYEKRGKAALPDCSQEEPDCQKCLSISECVWCLADQEGTNGECKETKDCLYRKTTCDSVALEDEGQKREPAEQSMEPKKVKNETMDADEFCKAEGRADCAHCARYEFCFWCQSTGSCNSYFNETTSRETCPTGNWYKDQCTYPGKKTYMIVVLWVGGDFFRNSSNVTLFVCSKNSYEFRRKSTDLKLNLVKTNLD